MPCPFFIPLQEADISFVRPARLPLGALYDGNCAAASRRAESILLCNFGYVRNRCADFPADAEVDAVRFSRNRQGAGVYILEKNFAPVKHGSCAELPPGSILAAQAAAHQRSCR